MTTSRILIPVLGSLLVLSSCTPYQEPLNIPEAPTDPALNAKPRESITESSQKKIKKQRKQVSSEVEEKAKPKKPSSASSEASSAKPKPKKKVYPKATPVPGKDGYVFSPYNNKVINVKGLPAGTLVKDPDDPAAAKRYFRVP